MEFINPAGFWAFLGVAALILIYLIRPKAKEVTIPSLMFFMKDVGRTTKKSFLERLLRNLVFFLQLMALAALALALTSPTMNLGHDTTAENTVMVIDVSASMQAKDNSRFLKAISTARESMKGDISIVTTYAVPTVILNKAPQKKAEEVLGLLRPGDTGTNLGDAMLLARDIIEGQEGRILVLSDFIYTEGPDPKVVKKILETEGFVVDFVNVGTEGNNAGIIDILLERHNAKVIVKNFDKEERAVTISVINDNAEIKSVSKTVLPLSQETIEFETPPGRSIVEIKDADDLKADNTLFITAPEKARIRTLLVTNRKNTYLKKALEASKDIDLEAAEPPIIPDIKDFDVIIFNDVEKDKILSGTIEGIVKAVETEGKGFIVMAQDDLAEFDFRGSLPVTLGEKVKGESASIYDFSQASEDKYDFAEEDTVDYGSTTEYLSATAGNDSTVYAQTGEDIPIIVSRKKGAGNIVYYGIFDSVSTFKTSPSYPLFWNKLINSLMGTEDINNYNFKSGKVMFFGVPTDVVTPDGRYRTTQLLMDRAGFYEIAGKSYAVNMLNEQESGIARETAIETERSEMYKAKKVEKREDVNIVPYLTLFILLMVIAELAYVKYSGEL